jgi:hypothetical protein
MWKVLKPVLIVGLLIFAGNYGWHFFTDPPSTTDVCYTWSKATDQFLQDESGIDGGQWLADNLKTEKDLVNIDKDVLSAMRLYDEGAVINEADPYERMGLRTFVLEACEKAAPGSTKHSQ